ncbi:hypothetical protein LAZ67_11001245 [Cordylochernes scorpioides]|uniref:Uncharacterized protein n=1 Tax=Cordylochernes scorpioides TaxID=51811 RepID=A0ABY6L135_9ARAC|nr:hypothetical protein LAZ67_11001245 [Cordylochernes scorpioides]
MPSRLSGTTAAIQLDGTDLGAPWKCDKARCSKYPEVGAGDPTKRDRAFDALWKSDDNVCDMEVAGNVSAPSSALQAEKMFQECVPIIFVPSPDKVQIKQPPPRKSSTDLEAITGSDISRRKWTPFTRGLSLVGRAKVLLTTQHHLHGYLSKDAIVTKLQTRLRRFIWGPDRTAWLPTDIVSRPVVLGGLGLLDIGAQLHLAFLKGVQASLRGGKNGLFWLVLGGVWLVPLPTLLELPIIGGCRFLRPPNLLAPARWSGVRVADLRVAHDIRPTRSSLAYAAALVAFCRRTLKENLRESTRAACLAESVVLRGTTTPFSRLTTRSARRALERPRLAAQPITRLLSKWTSVVDAPARLDWTSLRRSAFSGHEADIALRLALPALPHPDHPASTSSSCKACGSVDRSLDHRYWSCRRIRLLIIEAFSVLGRPPDLRACIFGSDLEDDDLAILTSAKSIIYRDFVQVGLTGGAEDPLIAWEKEKAPRLGSTRHHSAGTTGATRRQRSSGGWTPRVQEVKSTRAHIAEARARQAFSTQQQCVYIEHCPEFAPYHYLKATDKVVGEARHLIQLTRMYGHVLVGLTSKTLAERLMDEGLELEGVILKAFPFLKRSEKLTIGNPPFYVEDAVIIDAFRPYGRFTSIAPKQLEAGEYGYTDGRREAYILLHVRIKVKRLPTRLDIKTKGETLPAFLTFGTR